MPVRNVNYKPRQGKRLASTELEQALPFALWWHRPAYSHH